MHNMGAGLPLTRILTPLETVLTAFPKFNGEGADMSGVPNNKPRATAGRRLIALTNDAALSRALQELATGEVAVSIVADVRGLTDELMQYASATALVDASSLDAPVDAVVDAITAQFPDLRLMVAGQGAEQNLLTTRIANQTVFRFVHKPASPQRLKLFFDAAARPSEVRSNSPQIDLPKGGKEPLARIETAVRGKSPKTVAIIGVVALAAIAAAALVMWPKGEAPVTAAAPASAPAATGTSSPEALALVKKADLAFAAGKYVASDGSSAAEIYREALKLDPQNSVARAGFDRAIDYGVRSAEEALLAGKPADASAVSETLRLITPNNSRLAFLNTQIARELARVNADASQRQALEARQTQIRTALTAMSERMNRGALLDPSTNSAVSHFREAEAVGAGDPAVRSARESLVGALLTAADNELGNRRTQVARRMLDAAGSINSSAPGLDILRRRVEEVNSQAAAAAAEPAQAARTEAPAPAPVVAPAAEAAPAPAADKGNQVVSSSTLRVLRREPTVYPPRALQDFVSGWVELEFTVAKDGSVQDVIVIEAEPRRTFDSSAIAALRRYRYAPVIRDGQPVPQRARIRMRYTAQESK
jgi:TonB family protein